MKRNGSKGETSIQDVICHSDQLFVFIPYRQNKRRTFYIDPRCHPQTIAVVQTRAKYVNYRHPINVNDLSKQVFQIFFFFMV